MAPGLDKSAVRFEVVSEGERGLLGVGYTPARVIAAVDAPAVFEAAPAAAAVPAGDESELAADLRELLTRITAALDVDCRVDVAEDDEAVTGSLSGDDLGLLIGRHGQTIDAIQYLANAVAYRAYGDDRKDVVVDAAGYRERRRETLESLAMRSAEQRAVDRRAGRARADVLDRAPHRPPPAAGRAGRVDAAARATSPTGTSSSSPTDAWLERLLETPGLTAISDPAEARRVHLDESLTLVPFVERYEGTVSTSAPAEARPGSRSPAPCPTGRSSCSRRPRRKCDFLDLVARDFPNVRVVCGRAEEQPADSFGVAVAKALAPPPVALEWCLALVAVGGAAVLLVGPSADPAAVARVSEQLGGGEPEEHPGILVVPKLAPTPPGFPRRPGVARKRPLA